MDSIETFQNQNMVTAQTVGFRFEADLFKSVQIIIGFDCHGIVAAETGGVRFEADLSNQYRLCQAFVVMDNIETFHNKNVVAVETAGFGFEADLFKSVLIIVCFWCHGLH